MEIPKEPDIVINGVRLTHGQAMTVRVAIESFAGSLAQPDALGDDEVGRNIAKGYRARIEELRKIYMLNQ